MIGTEVVPETSVVFSQLTQLITPKAPDLTVVEDVGIPKCVELIHESITKSAL
jgi:hypothetical protein